MLYRNIAYNMYLSLMLRSTYNGGSNKCFFQSCLNEYKKYYRLGIFYPVSVGNVDIFERQATGCIRSNNAALQRNC